MLVDSLSLEFVASPSCCGASLVHLLRHQADEMLAAVRSSGLAQRAFVCASRGACSGGADPRVSPALIHSQQIRPRYFSTEPSGARNRRGVGVIKLRGGIAEEVVNW